jgi:amidohydrolase
VTHDALARDLGRLEPSLIALRRDLHRYPELGFREQRTAHTIAEALERLGLVVKRGVGGTGLVADLEGDAPGPTILLRADMDGLPVDESGARDYASRNAGVMHACGHDAHMAALVGAATLLCERKGSLAGRVRFAFQPAEETVGGALAMLEDGVLDGVDRALAAHVFSPLPFGVVGSTAGPFFGGVDIFAIEVVGRAGHGAMPESSVDPVLAAAQIVVALQSIVARETKPGERLVVSVTNMEAGRAVNVVVDRAYLRGTLRWQKESERQRAKQRLIDVAKGVALALRAEANVTFTGFAPVTVNDPANVDAIGQAVRATQRAELLDTGPLTVSEDFSFFLERVPGCLMVIGSGGPGAPPHHHHAFDLDERAIGLTAEVLARAALSGLAK